MAAPKTGKSASKAPAATAAEAPKKSGGTLTLTCDSTRKQAVGLNMTVYPAINSKGDDRLVIVIDPSKIGKESSTGKSLQVANTGGWTILEQFERFKITGSLIQVKEKASKKEVVADDDDDDSDD